MYRNRNEPPRNPDHRSNFGIPGFQDIGWQLMPDNPKLKACDDLGHKRREIDNSLYKYRATDRIYICDECKNYYHIDMSD